MAFYSGFGGERAERTWGSRVEILRQHGFIDVLPGSNGPISYILIFNPYVVLRTLHGEGKLSDGPFNALRQRMIEIGAQDLDEPEKPPPEPKKIVDALKAVSLRGKGAKKTNKKMIKT